MNNMFYNFTLDDEYGRTIRGPLINKKIMQLKSKVVLGQFKEK